MVDQNEKSVSFSNVADKIEGVKSSYFDVINSLQYQECNAALVNVMQRLDIDKIMELLDETPIITDVQREFYKHMLRARYQKILVASLKKLKARG